LERLNSNYIILSNAIESLTDDEREALRTWYYGKGSNEVKTLYRAFRRFKMFMLIQREKKRKQQELEYQLKIMRENGMEHTPRGKKLLAQVV
jgi:tRNA nucleotidyltransferase/poly(A) polymerase